MGHVSTVTCKLCPHHCSLKEGQQGICKGRICRNGEIICSNYGKLTSIALDPVEKKPLMQFFPGKMVLSIGSYGCNLHCPFCQNYEISSTDNVQIIDVPPEVLVAKAEELRSENNIGIAYTYNEPLISYEYLLDCARLAYSRGLKNVIVTNGMICRKPLEKLLPFIDAMNIDLKGFTKDFYDMVGGDLETVRETIRISAASCHIEVTTLVIPGKNDSEEEIAGISEWLASIDPGIPYHLSRYFPRYKMKDIAATPVRTIYRLAEIARKYLKYVYTGNC